MERGNTKHGPRLDDEMAHEVRGVVQGGTVSRVDEFHEPEPAGENQPSPSHIPGGRSTGGTPPDLTFDEIERRSRLGRYLPKSSLPGDREELISGAADLRAPDDVMEDLSRLPAGEIYVTVNEIWAALGGHNEARRR